MIVKAKTLLKKGLPSSKIRQLCHMKGSPFFQTIKGGTWWYEESKFDKWLDQLAEEKNER